MTYIYYPGCSQAASNKAYDLSTRALAKALGMELVELEDWNCCGASPSYSLRELPTYALAARNLALAERQGGACDLVTICNGCYNMLGKANLHLAGDPDLRRRVGEVLAVADLKYEGSIRVRHFLEVLVSDWGMEAIRERVNTPLEGLKVAPYYGCQFSRPSGAHDDPEFPRAMDKLLSWVGAEVVDYPLKAACCGGLLMTTKEEVALKLVRTLLAVAVERGADCMATACPLCQLNVEAYQDRVNSRFGTSFSLPILCFTQLLGLSLGLEGKALGLGTELVSAADILAPYLVVASREV
ncbi:MAG: CoB--CoM heterodisulfide reductase iron-sulfur subunit B family protein [Anaerolineae bacterium]